MEEWRAVVGFEGAYEVSDMGRVRSIPRVASDGRRLTGRVLRPLPHPYGYAMAALCRAGEYRKHLVHRLVLEAFVGPAPDGEEGCHGDGNPANNALTNLRWDTRRGNMADAVRHGTMRPGLVPGERNGMSKLNASDVRAMRSMRARGAKYSEIGGRFGVSDVQAGNVCSGRSWAHVQLEG